MQHLQNGIFKIFSWTSGRTLIGVDPYYFTYKARKIKYEPKVILSGRIINNRMAKYVFDKITYEKKFFGKMKIKILILGIAFKENISDIRNSQVIKILKMMKSLILRFMFTIHTSIRKKFFK